MVTSKDKAFELFNKHYFVLFDSDSDKGEEILVSLLAVGASLITVDEIISINGENEYWLEVKNHLKQILN
jgi:hypothetical protein